MSRASTFISTGLAALLWVGAASASAQSNWPVFRGGGVGVVQANTPAEWDGPSGKNILWKTPIPLPGKNSPIVWGGSIFLSGASKEKQEVYCIDSATGAIRWAKAVGSPDPEKSPRIMEDTGLAAATLATDGARVFGIFATGDLVALDFSGNVVWNKSLGPLDNQYGHASSLVMWRDRLIVQLDQGLEPEHGKSAILAFDSATGNEIWKTPRPVANSWTSPIVVSTPTGEQLITAANPFVIAYDPQRGSEIWRTKVLSGDVAPSPAYANGIAFVAMESALGNAIKTGGAGDVTKTHVAWEAHLHLPDIVSPLITDRFALTVMTYGTLVCYEAATGKMLWEQETDGTFHASPVMISNVVHLIDKKGVTYRFEVGSEFKLLNKPALGEAVEATPAVAGDRLYIRGEKHLYCIGVR